MAPPYNVIRQLGTKTFERVPPMSSVFTALAAVLNHLDKAQIKLSLYGQDNLATHIRSQMRIVAEAVVREVAKLDGPADSLNDDEIETYRTAWYNNDGVFWKGKIPCIKKVRERLNIGLLEAKQLVERWASENLVSDGKGNFAWR